ncbi:MULTISPECIES: DUF5954 family protein [Streptomyces]|uniref:Aromatic ring-opening dioxygenase LigA n=2 Tax=Streptomyces TaxID=1883 RepID=A0A0W7X213_9ACTN|nr:MULTISPECIES: DUF5954 family protein [Streptomyces]KUF16901.1 aromatic ring-opening dioxygenase LigA [Streptomyces silvensis]MVO87611.1 hypothetical protein [Streptomyces typhae]
MPDDWKRQIDALHSELVRRDDPAAWVSEADAVDASYRYPQLAVRGPVFGLASRAAGGDEPWRLLGDVMEGTPQQARDGLNSLLWFMAKDSVDDREQRCALLASVARLEREPVDELTVLGTRYRVIRGDEFARAGADGLEPPRPTDPEPAHASWDDRPSPSSHDEGFALDPARAGGLMAGALRIALRGFTYTGGHFPAAFREDSERAVRDYPEVVLLPVTFGVAERKGERWRPRGALMPTPHDARRLLVHGMTEIWPLVHEYDDDERADFARAAAEFKAAGRANEVTVRDRCFRVCRVERMVRIGADGPEAARPSDVETTEPMKLHPTMDEDGVIHYDA